MPPPQALWRPVREKLLAIETGEDASRLARELYEDWQQLEEPDGMIRALRLGYEGNPEDEDIRERLEPRFVGCFEEDGYTHDAEVVVYRGPDEEFVGREIMFACVK